MIPAPFDLSSLRFGPSGPQGMALPTLPDAGAVFPPGGATPPTAPGSPGMPPMPNSQVEFGHLVDVIRGIGNEPGAAPQQGPSRGDQQKRLIGSLIFAALDPTGASTKSFNEGLDKSQADAEARRAYNEQQKMKGRDARNAAELQIASLQYNAAEDDVKKAEATRAMWEQRHYDENKLAVAKGENAIRDRRAEILAAIQHAHDPGEYLAAVEAARLAEKEHPSEFAGVTPSDAQTSATASFLHRTEVGDAAQMWSKTLDAKGTTYIPEKDAPDLLKTRDGIAKLYHLTPEEVDSLRPVPTHENYGMMSLRERMREADQRNGISQAANAIRERYVDQQIKDMAGRLDVARGNLEVAKTSASATVARYNLMRVSADAGLSVGQIRANVQKLTAQLKGQESIATAAAPTDAGVKARDAAIGKASALRAQVDYWSGLLGIANTTKSEADQILQSLGGQPTVPETSLGPEYNVKSKKFPGVTVHVGGR